METNSRYDAVFAVLEHAVARGVTPGAVAYVARRGAVEYHEAHGVLASHPDSDVCGVPVTRHTRFDLSSLTKVLATTSIAARYVSEGRMSLGEPLPRPFHEGYPEATLRDLLEHCAGFAAHRPFYAREDHRGRSALLRAVARAAPDYPTRARAVYSDLGFMVLGAWLEYVGGDRLDRLFRREMAAFIHHDDTTVPTLGFRPTEFGTLSWRDERDVAPTEVYEEAARADPTASHVAFRRMHHSVAHGVVHDDNAFVMDGVAGHAGLFGTAQAVADVAAGWLYGTMPGLDVSVRDIFWRPSEVSGSVRRLGWDGVELDGQGSTGDALSAGSVGHLGFTGCSVWIDPMCEGIYVLLTNRVHPSRGDLEDIRGLRRAFHGAAAR